MAMRFTIFLLLASLCHFHATEVPSPPEFIKQHHTGTILFQENLENPTPVLLECEAQGEPVPSYRWIKDGKPFDWQVLDNRISQQPGRGSLHITSLSKSDVGIYQCFAENKLGVATSNTIALQEIESDTIKKQASPSSGNEVAPHFTVEPESVNAAEDDTVEFHCEAAGVPEPHIEWIHNGKPLEEAPPNPRRKINPNSIVIEKVNKDDIGNYGCKASNNLGHVYKDVYVNVLALPPEITEAPRDVEAANAKDINISCKVFGVPKPKVKWTHDGKELTGDRYKILENEDLHISNIQLQDGGEYTCHADNKYGTASASITLTVKD
ncbi:hypothetical protein ILUMI_04732 [Ignelater luminosus]|uniref:Ig-like domain-containing protein n=1 Tax=Ignelater luminosus TaxID=2038154 RepID=A0A8K0GJB2_IGNLU|nr:hypothetical protein ILUMI_04732 [Ignelater luminosus]